MRRFFLKTLASFDPASKYDWFLLVAMIYMSFLVLMVLGMPSEPPPPPEELSPFG